MNEILGNETMANLLKINNDKNSMKAMEAYIDELYEYKSRLESQGNEQREHVW